jgi:hypothetical protein
MKFKRDFKAAASFFLLTALPAFYFFNRDTVYDYRKKLVKSDDSKE